MLTVKGACLHILYAYFTHMLLSPLLPACAWKMYIFLY